jgi:hypothetical protein
VARGDGSFRDVTPRPRPEGTETRLDPPPAAYSESLSAPKARPENRLEDPGAGLFALALYIGRCS